MVLLLATLSFVLAHTLFYTVTTFALSYGTTTLQLDRTTMLLAAMIAVAVMGAATLWFAASVAGLFGVVMALADGDGLRERLTATAYETDPAATADAVGDAVRMTILVVLGTVVGLTVLGLVWTALLLRRRSWARWALLVTGLATLFAADLAQSLVTGGPDLDRLSLLAQLCAVVVATGLSLAPSTRAWLRRDVTP